MADLFYQDDAVNLLRKKHIAFFGDSNTRAVYKDLVMLLSKNKLLDQNDLKKKQEPSFCGDKLGKHSEVSRAREYEEERTYLKNNVRVDFFFITRCYNALLVDMMEDIHLGLRKAPDVIYINSTLWDVCRWGPDGVTEFKDNLQKLARMFKSSLPKSTLVIWATALPVSQKLRSSLLIKQIDFLRYTLHFDVMEANMFARQVMVSHGFDVLDIHYHLRMQIHRRTHDGVHFYPIAVRLITNLLLTHIALSWDFTLPNRVETILLEKAKAQCAPQSSAPIPNLKSPKLLSNKPKKAEQHAAKPKSANDKQYNAKSRNQNNYREKKYVHSKRRNNQNNSEFHQRAKQRELDHHRPGRVKSVNRNNWSSDNQRSWSVATAPSNIHSSANFAQQWTNHPQIWSEDVWLDEQRFGDKPRFQNEQRFTNESRFRGDSMFGSSFRQSSSPLPRTTRKQPLISNMRGQKRYAPY